MKHFALLFVSAIALSASLRAQPSSSTNTSTYAVPFLLIAPDARAAGMGDGSMALSNDANAMYWNASRLAFVKEKCGTSISYTRCRSGMYSVNHLAFISQYYKPDSVSAVGLSAGYFRLPRITLLDDMGEPVGEFRPNEFAVDAGYARQLSPHFAAGLTAGFIRSNLTNGITIDGNDTKASTGCAFDVSATYRSDVEQQMNWQRQLIIAFSLTDLGPKMSYWSGVNKQPLPTRLGIAAGVEMRSGNGSALNGQAELSKVTDGSSFAHFMSSCGVEYIHKNIFKLRVGYFYEPETLRGYQYMTLGAGLQHRWFRADVAYLLPTNIHAESLTDMMRFTLICQFSELKS